MRLEFEGQVTKKDLYSRDKGNTTKYVIDFILQQMDWSVYHLVQAIKMFGKKRTQSVKREIKFALHIIERVH